eukprot:TRINITY_DN54406_c0_g1_i1.p1 TRINITY_DN54406_c0_g1~~TRINITY_DN54406_c0_g1_i1.p1  ORF type:complete len:750 (-),score=97.47 TRINITY_DN54406_c0_g1_i1:119-2368(-)
MADASTVASEAAEYSPPPGLNDYVVPSLLTPCVFYDSEFIPASEATSLFEELKANVAWEKNARINRWVALFGDEGVDYRYRDQPSLEMCAWTKSMAQVKASVEGWYKQRTGLDVSFNVCLLNFYENGDHRIGWHYDREEIGRSTPIVSISLGAPRTFLVKAKPAARGSEVKDEVSLKLSNGSLLLMENICQHKYVHSVPSTTDVPAARINLTFRCKLEKTDGEMAHDERRQAIPCYLKDPPPMVSSVVPSGCSEVFGATQDFNYGGCPLNANVRFLVITQLGTEQYVAAEIAELAAELECLVGIVAKPWDIPGVVSCSLDKDSCDDKSLMEKLLSLRSAQHVLRYHHHFCMSEVRREPPSGVNMESKSDPIPDGKHESNGNDAPQPRGDNSEERALDKASPSAVTGKSAPAWAKLTAEDLYAHVKDLLVSKRFHVSTLEVPDSAKGDKPSFRVTCNRMGTHTFNSAEVEREIGGALQEYYDSKADMKDFDVHVRADIVGRWCILGTQCNTKDMSLRHKLVYLNRVTLKCNLAYIMLRAAGVKAGDTIVDPFCGSGTVMIEAAEWLQGDLKGIGFDTNRKAVNGAAANAKAENFSDCCKFHCLDARALRKICADDSVDAVVANVPWGVQVGQFIDLDQLYEVVLRNCWYVLKPGGRIVFLVLRGLQMMSILRRLSGRWRTLGFQAVRTTNNLPCIVVAEKLPQDVVGDNLKRQLYEMSQYVNLAPEMYRALHTEGGGDDDKAGNRGKSQS